ncbi:hypothetical protein GGI15_002731 [Coemansia interrupta]|uniref:SWIRM domain-containing protein n=1 Tax=Coemansia interrupta TaxID=1126814 RepID=A0A9W8HC85_9FUNG|nr:hypothetical protein GGI15_002731 [Coemansia interrupta]
MAPTAVQQSFWDRIPHATSKLAMLGKSDRSTKPQKKHKQAASAYSGSKPSETPASRASKRKQSHPMRSPLSQNSAGTGSNSLSVDTARPCRIGLDQRIPVSQSLQVDTRNLSRAFRMSFSDEYLKNPQEYVQALADCEYAIPVPASPSSRSQGNARSRNGSAARNSPNRSRGDAYNGGRAGLRQTVSSKRVKTGRFHNLQMVQSLSDNDDATSVTTAASDINDPTDVDSQTTPGIPAVRGRHRLAVMVENDAETETEAEGGADTAASGDSDGSKPPTPHQFLGAAPRQHNNNRGDNKNIRYTSHQQAAAPNASQQSYILGDSAEAETGADNEEYDESNPNSVAETPSLVTTPPLPLHELGEDNIPSYERNGQVLVDDVSVITPPAARSTVKWTKAEPIDISDRPLADKLAAAERHCCSVLRILPEQYIAIKQTLLREGKARIPGTFKKRDAQRLCRIDVNKTSKIYEWYVTIGWLPSGSGLYAQPSD